MGLIGDGTTAALVGLDGGVAWLCVPRFDSEPLFCSLLDHGRGGHFTVAPDDVVEARQRHEPDTAVLVTELQRAIVISCAGTDLSLPEIITTASCGCPSVWISIIAAMMSRETSE